MEKSNKSLLWEYFEKLPDGSDRCKTCKKQICGSAAKSLVFIRAYSYIRVFEEKYSYFTRIFVIYSYFL